MEFSTLFVVVLVAWAVVGIVPILRVDDSRTYRAYLGIAFAPSLLLVCVGLGVIHSFMALLEYFAGE